LRIIRKRSGPACQWPTSAHGHVSQPTRVRERSGGLVTTRHLTPTRSTARHVPSTHRACGHRPVRPYLTLSWSEGEAPPLPQLLITPARCSAPLPPIAFLGHEDLPGANAPPPASSSPSRAPPSPGAPHRPLLSRRRAPHRPLTSAPLRPTAITAALRPKSGSLSTGLTPRPFSRRPAGFGR
jgi:hypothetical protein